MVVFGEVGRKNAEAGRNEPLLWNYSRGELVEIPKKLVESPPPERLHSSLFSPSKKAPDRRRSEAFLFL
ncbi:hypothetical protein C6Y45_09390 [Alkalicoccus saliphilus]|uniref:Uncharacterized protein n=1 Tax=Alkalicoccus saliphilus TaxID=200989 RepID=A0A2T4U5Z9_9BACI|nr:hypothetical protein C6Y45_09390 [Alkalicoccus saliphilus]